MYDFLVIGGGAAGFFAAINVKNKVPGLKVGILEKQGKVLQKVKVSGGGRCNVTNKIADPETLASHYPRGGSFLKEAFVHFNSSHTQEWFAARGVPLKTEADGRVFPQSDSSQSVIDCFLREARNIELILHCRVERITPISGGWEVITADGKVFQTRRLMLATGSDGRVWDTVRQLGLAVTQAVPSLFTFNIEDPALNALPGISFPEATVTVKNSTLKQSGPLLITHWGLSGPAILKLSAWGAYQLQKSDYKFEICVNWLAQKDRNELEEEIKRNFQENPKKNIRLMPISGLSQRFWNYICEKSGISEFQKGAEGGKKQLAALLENLTAAQFRVDGKSTFKEEFVTAGGVDLSEVNHDNFVAHRYPDLYLGGEVLNIDAVTGGFNFQAAWTAGWQISEDIYQKYC